MLRISSTNLISLTNLRDDTNTLISNATVTGRVRETNGGEITGVTFPVTLNPVAGQDGAYKYLLPDTAGIVLGKSYDIEVVVTVSNLKLTIFKRVIADRYEGE